MSPSLLDPAAVKIPPAFPGGFGTEARPQVGVARHEVRPAADDLREHHRRQVQQELWLSDLSGETVLRCTCRDLSAGGLYATAPVGYGLAIGQRYELRLAPEMGGRAGSFLLGDSLGYATIIRTHLDTHQGEDAVGFAARFDTPRYLPLRSAEVALA